MFSYFAVFYKATFDMLLLHISRFVVHSIIVSMEPLFVAFVVVVVVCIQDT